MTNSDLKEEQQKVCEKYQSPAFFCGEEEKLGIALKSLTKTPIYGVRRARKNDTCGWYLWAGEFSDAEEFFPLCMWSIFLKFFLSHKNISR
ncbi:immunity protein Imm33 domain-containing protein [Variovorax paradoxus]|uniref:immunity protein Imm33 domain-containing protein n=1 Tax=Variovorax paradoxus TaxID=34073 RepID=UPI0029C61576|nr:hypothetical protein RZE77_31805 [Variovorax paradoxus]